jgi:hypothetical protein
VRTKSIIGQTYRSGLAAAILGLEALFSPKLCHNFLNIKFQAMIPHSN